MKVLKETKMAFSAGWMGVLSAVLLTYARLQHLTSEEMTEIGKVVVGGVVGLYVIAALQVFVITFIAWWGGSKLATKVGYTIIETGMGTKKKFKESILWSIGIVVGILVLDKFIFGIETPFDFDTSLYLVLYGGLIEEVWFRLGLMTLFTFVFYKMFTKNVTEVPKWVHMAAIGFTTLLLFSLQLPIIQETVGLSLFTLTRSVLAYAIPSIVFGYIYWKNGLSYSILGHTVAMVVANFIVIPLLGLV